MADGSVSLGGGAGTTGYKVYTWLYWVLRRNRIYESYWVTSCTFSRGQKFILAYSPNSNISYTSNIAVVSLSVLPSVRGNVPTYTIETALYFYTNHWSTTPATIPLWTVATSIPWYILCGL